MGADQPGWHRGDWMQTFTGRQFYPLAPAAEDVDPRDIAHHLSMLCRYAGAVSRFYSVAEHCVLMSRWFGDTPLGLEALLHDATEAYCVDVPRPLKKQLPQYRDAERVLAIAVAERFGQQTIVRFSDDEPVFVRESPEVTEADTRILLDERAVLMASPPASWGVDSFEPLGVQIHGWQPAEAEYEYLVRLRELGVSV